MVIVVYNNKGGVGKTTLATHIFRHLMFTGERWAFYDADPQQDGLSWMVGHDQELRSHETIPIADGVSGDDLGSIVTRSIDAALELPNIIVDAPPRGDVLRRLADSLSVDLVIVPVGGRLSLDGAQHVVEESEGARTVIVFNKTDSRHPVSEVEVRAARRLGVEVYPYAIPESAVVRKGELAGLPVWEVPHGERTHATKMIRGLCEWIAGGAGPLPEPEQGSEGGKTDIWDRHSL